MKMVNGFSKLSRDEKIKWLGETCLNNSFLIDQVSEFWMKSNDSQNDFESLSENTISNFHLPFGISPNLLLNGKTYCLPMVTEESSVVAAMAMTSKFWAARGGIKSKIISLKKTGHIHFIYKQDSEILNHHLNTICKTILEEISDLDSNMKKRGGGIQNIKLNDCTDEKENYYNLEFEFLTCDAMGANYINSILEKSTDIFKKEMVLRNESENFEVVMAILSNYTPECLVSVSIKCPVSKLGTADPYAFAHKFKDAVEIANCNTARAATHNKGIMNGIDSVVIATGNDFRAVEAGVHSYCCKDGKYRGLGECVVSKTHFEYTLEIPLSLGTVGGVTSSHEMAKLSLDILGNPNSSELMMIIASAGIIQNFAALKALTTVGIQKGHMRMHLKNILIQLDATKNEVKYIEENTKDLIVSFDLIRKMLKDLKNLNTNKNIKKMNDKRWGANENSRI